MTVFYGVLAAIPMMWGYAGYVMVSHPGTAEADGARQAAECAATAS
ncbi:hypothetical protein [Mycobacterium sp. IEC1808]|nr:hypothetical protein [Mycobacterium sp. IEC1808]